MSDFEHIICKLRKVTKAKGYMKACCPAHQDDNSSLTVRVSEKGDLLLKCFAGCSFDDIVKALGVTKAECFASYSRKESREVCSYDYCDEQGTLLYQVVRFDPKDFRQRRPKDGLWEWGLGDTRRVLYRLPEVVDARNSGRRVLIVEGERDVDSLAKHGLLATCNPMGAGKWQESYSLSLIGRTCIIIPDNDQPGEKHAQEVYDSLRPHAAQVVILKLDGAKDVTEWLESHSLKELKALCVAALGADEEQSRALELVGQIRTLRRPSRWLAVRKLISDLEGEE